MESGGFSHGMGILAMKDIPALFCLDNRRKVKEVMTFFRRIIVQILETLV